MQIKIAYYNLMHPPAAIMFTDIVGYTALMGKDEEQAFQLLDKSVPSKIN